MHIHIRINLHSMHKHIVTSNLRCIVRHSHWSWFADELEDELLLSLYSPCQCPNAFKYLQMNDQSYKEICEFSNCLCYAHNHIFKSNSSVSCVWMTILFCFDCSRNVISALAVRRSPVSHSYLAVWWVCIQLPLSYHVPLLSALLRDSCTALAF